MTARSSDRRRRSRSSRPPACPRHAVAVRRTARRARPATSRRPKSAWRREVGGRVLELTVDEGDRVAAGDVARAARYQRRRASRCGAPKPSATGRARSCGCCRPARGREDIRQARAQVESAQADVARRRGRAAAPPTTTSQRFEALLASNAGSRKQRDDAATRRDVAAARVAARAGAGAGGRRSRRAAARRRAAGGDRRRRAPASPRSTRRSPSLRKNDRRRRPRRRRSPASSPRSWSMPARLIAPRTPVVGRSPISITRGPTSTWTSRSCRG